MTKFYVCMPSVIDEQLRTYQNELYAYTSNEYLLNQYIKTTYPRLQETVDIEYELNVEEYMAVDEDHLFQLVKDEHGWGMDDQNRIFSITSANNPEVALYLTQYTSESFFFTDYDSVFDTFLRVSYRSTKTYNIMKNALRVPDEIKDMMELIDGKYLSLLFALGYSDMYNWNNESLKEIVNKQLPDGLKGNMDFLDIMDEGMVMILFGQWYVL